MKTLPLCLLAASTSLLLQSCVTGPATSPAWPGAWPPVSAQCVRNDPVPFASQFDSIGGELTRLHADPACVPQPTCAGWTSQEHHQLPGPSTGSSEWSGYTNHMFALAEQNAMIANARATAIAQTPPNKQFYRLTFRNDIVVATGPAFGFVFAEAYYGQCIADVTNPHNPTDEQ